MSDVAIIGGGVIGLTLAYRLAEQGVTVTILEQGSGPGQEASWAGAGMLPPGNPQRAETAEARLRAASHVLWPSLSQQLLQETGIDNGFQLSGGLEVRAEETDASLETEIEQWQREGVAVERLDASALARHEPHLSQRLRSGYHLPELGQIRNPRHVKALTTACLRRGVRLLTGTPVLGLQRAGERITAVHTPAGLVSAGQFVVTSGAWTSRLLADIPGVSPIVPVRGQIVLLTMQSVPLTHVINAGPRYIVPRTDGRILIGATEELAGFDKRNTAQGIRMLMTLATDLVPLLEQATFERSWAGLRPRSVDGLPYLGRISGFDNLFMAAGHFRAGLQLSPITATVLTQVLLGQPVELDLASYAPERHASSASSATAE